MQKKTSIKEEKLQEISSRLASKYFDKANKELMIKQDREEENHETPSKTTKMKIKKRTRGTSLAASKLGFGRVRVPATEETIGEDSFGSVFSSARGAGKSTFDYNGKSYTTKKAGETDAQWKSSISSTKTADAPIPAPRPSFRKSVKSDAATSPSTATSMSSTQSIQQLAAKASRRNASAQSSSNDTPSAPETRLKSVTDRSSLKPTSFSKVVSKVDVANLSKPSEKGDSDFSKKVSDYAKDLAYKKVNVSNLSAPVDKPRDDTFSKILDKYAQDRVTKSAKPIEVDSKMFDFDKVDSSKNKNLQAALDKAAQNKKQTFDYDIGTKSLDPSMMNLNFALIKKAHQMRVNKEFKKEEMELFEEDRWKYLTYSSREEAAHARKKHFETQSGNPCRHMTGNRLAYKGTFGGPKPKKIEYTESVNHSSPEVLSEIGDTEQGQKTLRSYVRKAAHKFSEYEKLGDNYADAVDQARPNATNAKKKELLKLGTKKAGEYWDKSHTKIIGIQRAGKRIKEDIADIAEIDETSISESLKLIKTYTNGNKSAKIHKDSEWNEYKVSHYVDGKHKHKADYFTDDKDDAHGTAQIFVKSTKEDVNLEEDQDGVEKVKKSAKKNFFKMVATQHKGVSYWNDGSKESPITSVDKTSKPANGRYKLRIVGENALNEISRARTHHYEDEAQAQIDSIAKKNGDLSSESLKKLANRLTGVKLARGKLRKDGSVMVSAREEADYIPHDPNARVKADGTTDETIVKNSSYRSAWKDSVDKLRHNYLTKVAIIKQGD